jgi:hypothetical protein
LHSAPDRIRNLLRLAAALLAMAAAAACATVPKAAPPLPGAAGAGGTPGAAATAPPAWQVPAAAYGSQILYRVAVAGAEGDASLSLTLRLASPERYQAQAVDPFGRAVWGLDVDGDRGLWLDHRGHTWCRLAGALDLAFLPLGPLSLAALPPLLLGRLPVPPSSPASVVRGAAAGDSAGTAVSYRDAAGRGWSAVVEGGRVVSWGLWPDAAAAPTLSWVSSGAWSVLSDRRKGVQVRWREAVREPLRPLAPLAPRADYRERSCAAGPPPAGLGPGAGHDLGRP